MGCQEPGQRAAKGPAALGAEIAGAACVKGLACSPRTRRSHEAALPKCDPSQPYGCERNVGVPFTVPQVSSPSDGKVRF